MDITVNSQIERGNYCLDTQQQLKTYKHHNYSRTGDAVQRDEDGKKCDNITRIVHLYLE